MLLEGFSDNSDAAVVSNALLVWAQARKTIILLQWG